VVRRVLPHEYAKYCTHLKSLDPESRTFRFGHAVSDQFIDTLCDRFQQDTDHNILFCVENKNLEFIAIGHIALAGNNTELAFSVLKQHQGQGLGSLLMKRCIQWCRVHNVLDAYMICVSTNSRIKNLCVRHGIKITNQNGEILASIKLPVATPATFVEEFASVNLATIDYFNKRLVQHWID
jgi:GNAT superfamily N-acetyltransferase